jgi:hypothetical protein
MLRINLSTSKRRRGRNRARRARHGQATHGRTTEYVIWSNVVQRCTNRENPSCKNYGARGIKVCDRWRESFEAFYADVGPRPSADHSLDRRDNEGHYEPGNVRWATRAQQVRNCRTAVFHAIDGESMLLVDWSKRTGVPESTIRRRLALGWSARDAIFTPVGGRSQSATRRDTMGA